MKRICELVLVMSILVCGTSRAWGGQFPAGPEQDPDKTFQQACELVAALESKSDLLKGVSKAKPVVKRDAKGQMTSGYLAFSHNAKPPGKNGTEAIDDTRPFFYVSVSLWSGRTPTPPADLHEFEWKGQTFQMWVQVYASDADLIRTVRKAVDEPLRGPVGSDKGPGRIDPAQPGTAPD